MQEIPSEYFLSAQYLLFSIGMGLCGNFSEHVQFLYRKHIKQLNSLVPPPGPG